MKVRYLGESDPIGLKHGEIYNVNEISQKTGWYRIVTEYDDEEEGYPAGYLYPPEDFEIVEG
ncbi:MAG: hypothetical protein DBX44_06705 [Oscillospiraceae bacterium]|nr:MAG: hypothetical protein DBX44_06705 [Oscillospiraceae bacterium]